MNTKKWWQTAIGYEIYPQSFFDSNDDGWGDLQGIIQKLDYLHDLGVNLLWICPFLQSPMDDNGYDVSNHFQVDPHFGKNEDLKMLIDQAHQRDIKIVMDFVLNHTSDEHPWFKIAINNPLSQEHEYYIWQKPRGFINGVPQPPNNWRGFFSDSAWAYVTQNKEYYMKIFSKKMPDLNWENPRLREEIYQIARYYLDLGIDGFRVDAIAHLARDLSFANSTQNLDSDGLTLDVGKFSNRDRLFDYLHEFKEKVLIKYPHVMTIGEVGGNSSTATALRYASRTFGAINMVFNFDTCWENGAYGSDHLPDEMIKTNLVNMKHIFKRWYDDCHLEADMPLYWVNHDHPRVLSQYGDINYRKESAKMLISVLLFMYGTPFIYNGDEIGMSNLTTNDLTPFMQDVSARNYIYHARMSGKDDAIIARFLKRTSRINARTPMQWDNTPFAGFSKHQPVIPANSNYPEVNVANELLDEDSILNYYRQAIKLRKSASISKLVLDGPFVIIDMDHPDVFFYRHCHEQQQLFVIANFRDKVIEYQHQEITKFAELLLHNYKDVERVDDKMTLKPFECCVFLNNSGGK
ncbi:MAG TPA: alpha-glucosidase [Bacilli bacterium]|jgi:glycosidase|nr:alpha-glucosidase [Bacilli bacterium]MDD3389233.1 alpha-glucosidase [Bacilli bacterium]MDD4520982.1 alpha-glucosidase [Bacilli bacterium]HKM10750.1 alpha-glucosidase [Bacilli bacterium]